MELRNEECDVEGSLVVSANEAGLIPFDISDTVRFASLSKQYILDKLTILSKSMRHGGAIQVDW
jgi:hypothetical protein